MILFFALPVASLAIGLLCMFNDYSHGNGYSEKER